MGDNSAIEWTDATWNPTVGCSVISPGCAHCYAMRMAARLESMGQARYASMTTPSKAGFVWTGEIRRAPEATLFQPLRWHRPRTIFVNSMSDLFHEAVDDTLIDYVFAVMAIARRHTYQVLTKRSQRMLAYLSDPDTPDRVHMAREAIMRRVYPELFGPGERLQLRPWPLENVWPGVSAEDQPRANDRIPHLVATPASKRFLSCEPLLGFVVLAPEWLRSLDWVIVGGESGPDARPMHPDWALSLRDQCAGSGVPFFFKQWGEFSSTGFRVGKRRAGAELDGREWREMPT